MTLVTGASGQLGFELHRILDDKATFLDRKALDLSQTGSVADLIESLKPELVINAGAYTAVDKAESEKTLAFKVNRDTPAELARLAELHRFKLIHLSTDYVFDGNSNTPYREDDPTHPMNVYGASKRDGEIEVLKNNPSALIVRTSWVYSKHGKNFIKTILRLAQERKTMSVVNDQTGSPTWAKDLAEVLIRAQELSGIYHFTNEGQCTWFELAKAVAKTKRLSLEILPISTAEYPTPARRPAYSLLNKDKIKGSLGLQIPDWMESLESCLNELS